MTETNLPAVNETNGGALLGVLTPQMVEQAERSVELVRRAIRAALAVTSESDWKDFQGKPYLQASGCDKVAALFGVTFEEQTVQEQRDKVGEREVRRFVCQLTARVGGRSVMCEGVASSDDKFFGMRDKQRIPLDEIDLDSVRKKAATNARARALTTILGLANISWKEIKSLSGARVASVQFGGKSADRRAGGAGQWTAAKRELAEVILDLASGDKARAADLLEELTAFQGRDGQPVAGRRSVADLSDRQAEVTLSRARTRWEELAEADPAAADGPAREPGEDG